MKTEKKLTGYPSIDKPWLKYYTEEAINAPLPECTIYEYLWENNKDHLDDVAITYFEKKITYREFFKKIEQTACALTVLGISKGDVVTIQALSLPQVIYLLYALNKLGAIANLVYATLKKDEVESNLNDTNSKLYITIDSIYYGFGGEIKSGNLNKTILLSIGDEMDFITRTVYKIKAKPKKVKNSEFVVSWNSFLSYNNGNKTYTAGNFDDTAVIVYTGGTTGKSKGVMLTNKNLNCSALQCSCFGINKNDIYLSVLPPFIAFGISLAIHLPFSIGTNTHLGVSADSLDISEIVKKVNPEYLICGTIQAEKMMKKFATKNIDLSNLKWLVLGGDSISSKFEQEINNWLLENNSNIKVSQGYALSEISASAGISVFTPKIQILKENTVGIPLVHTTFKIVDSNNNEVKYNEQGEICISSPCVMKGYFNDKEETDNILKTHSDGKKWLHTGDIGSIDEDGFITVVGRIKRMILTIQDGVCHKVFPKLAEDEYLKLDFVNAISIVGRTIGNGINELIAFVVLKDGENSENAEKLLKTFAENNFERYETPAEFRFVKELPLTTIGKVDYRALEQEAEKKE